MANEITLTGLLSVTKGSISETLSVTALKVNLTGTKVTKNAQTIPTTAGGTALKIGDLGSLGYYFIKNLDPTNYVELMDAVSGNKFNQIDPGCFVMGKFSSGISAPAAIAHTASCLIDYEIAEL